MKEFFNKLKSKFTGVGVWIVFIIIILIVVVPYVALLITLRKQEKTITLKPTLGVVDIKNSTKVDMDMVADAVDSGKALLEKLKGL